MPLAITLSLCSLLLLVGAAGGNPIVDKPGLEYSGAFPPDSAGDVGAAFYVQAAHGGSGVEVAVYDKMANLLSTFDFSSLFSSPCADSPTNTPSVVYDEPAERYVVTAWVFLGGGSDPRFCVAISQTADPRGAYYTYQFTAVDVPNFARFAAGPDAYYATSSDPFSDVSIHAFDRPRMLAGLAVAPPQRFTVPSLPGFTSALHSLAPADVDGADPPAGSPHFFVRHRDDEVHDPGTSDPTRDFLELYALDVDFDVPGNSSLTGPTQIPVAEFDSDLCGLVSNGCFPQAANGTLLDPNSEVMSRVQYRNFGTHESLVGSFAVDVGDSPDHGGIRWFELRSTEPGAIAWPSSRCRRRMPLRPTSPTTTHSSRRRRTESRSSPRSGRPGRRSHPHSSSMRSTTRASHSALPSQSTC